MKTLDFSVIANPEPTAEWSIEHGPDAAPLHVTFQGSQEDDCQYAVVVDAYGGIVVYDCAGEWFIPPDDFDTLVAAVETLRQARKP